MATTQIPRNSLAEVPTLVPIEGSRCYPSEAEAADGRGGIRELGLDDGTVMPGVGDRLVTVSFGNDAIDPHSYEFDLTPEHAWHLAIQLIATASLVEARR